ncbi:MAG: MurR/RpiR family transcriptional regulator [Burkholderiales bacterium]|nr:MurR/RpiR family transcriptional regulator [Burkholderiales bacterium]
MTASSPPSVAEEPLEARIRARYPGFSAADRRLADAVLARRDALLGLSATELAQLADVSKASAARFFRRLGFVDFNAFRARVREEASNQAPLHRMAQRRPSRNMLARLAQHARNDADCLGRLGAVVDGDALERAVALLAKGRRVWILGYRNAHTVASYAHALLHQVRTQVALLNDAAARESELLADLDQSDVVLAIDLRRRSARLPVLLAAVHDAGARLVLLTDARISGLEARADAVLRSPTHLAQLFDAYVAPISLVNFLASEVAARTDSAARKRLARIEKLHQELADLERDPGSDRKTVT